MQHRLFIIAQLALAWLISGFLSFGPQTFTNSQVQKFSAPDDLPSAAATGFFVTSARSSQQIAQCIPVTTVIQEERILLPLAFKGGGSLAYDPQSVAAPAIRSVTEDTGGCLKIVGETIHFTLDAGEAGGSASVDLGSVHRGILLYDDGAHGDHLAQDGVYERDYLTTSQDIARTVLIYGHFTSAGGQNMSAVSEGRVTIVDWSTDHYSTAPAAPDQIVSDPQAGVKYAGNRLIFVTQDSATIDQVLLLLRDNNLTLASWVPGLNSYEVEFSAGQTEATVAAALQSSPWVASVSRNLVMHLFADPVIIPDERTPIYQASYLNLIRAKSAWELGYLGSGIEVAVLDTGADLNHPDLENQIIGYEVDANDQDGHGSFVSGVIAAENGNGGISGVAPGAGLSIHNTAHGLVNQSDFLSLNAAAVIDDLIDTDVRVINMSWGNTPFFGTNPLYNSGHLRSAIEKAYEADIVLVAAAGYSSLCHCDAGIEIAKADTGYHLNGVYPASYTRVLAVGSTTQADEKSFETNYGVEVIFAPGEGVFSTSKDGSYVYGSGNSFSAPQVSALAALILSARPSLHNYEVIDIIKRSADPGPGLGRINVRRAIIDALTGTTPAEDSLPAAPTNLQAVLNGGSVQLSWTNSADADRKGVNIYRAEMTSGKAYPDDFPLDMVKLEGSYISGASYSDNSIEPGKSYQYFAFTLDQHDQESADFTYVKLKGWQEVGLGSASGGGISNNIYDDFTPDLAVAPDGKVYAAWEDGPSFTYIYIKRWNGSAWEQIPVGSAQGSGVSGSYFTSSPSIAVDSSSVPFVAYTDQLDQSDWNSDEIVVRYLSGNTWLLLGNPVSQGASCESNYNPSLAITQQGQIYVSWFCVTTPKTTWTVDGYVYVKRWNGNSWVAAFSGSASGTGIGSNNLTPPSMVAAPDGALYFSLIDSSWENFRIKRWNGQSLSTLGGTLEGSRPALAVNRWSDLFVGWVNWNTDDIHVKRWNGTSWVSMDSSIPSGLIGSTAGSSLEPALAARGPTDVHAVWSDSSSGNLDIYAKYWENGWKEKGLQAAQAGGISKTPYDSMQPVLVYGPNGELYVAWQDYTTAGDTEIYILKWLE